MSADPLPSVFELALARMDSPETPYEIASRRFPEILDAVCEVALGSRNQLQGKGLCRRFEIIAGIHRAIVAALNGTQSAAGRPENSFAVISLRYAAYELSRREYTSHVEALDAAARLLGGRPNATRSSIQKAIRRWRAVAPDFFRVPYSVRPSCAQFPSVKAREISFVLDTIEVLLTCRNDRERMARERMPDRHGGRRNPPSV